MNLIFPEKKTHYFWLSFWLLTLFLASVSFLGLLFIFDGRINSIKLEQKVIPLQQLSRRSENNRGVGLKTSINNPTAILMYHYIREVDKEDDPLGFSLSVSPTDFEKQIQFLIKNYHIISARKFLAGQIPDRAIILTFDDGYEDFYTQAAPILQRYHLPSISFIITSKINQPGYLTRRQIKILNRFYRVEFGSHTVSHPNLARTSFPNQLKEIGQSQQDLALILDRRVDYFCYPSGAYNQETLMILRRAGYRLAMTTREGLANRRMNLLLLPRIRMTGSMGLTGLKEKLDQFFQHTQPGAS